MKINRHHIRGMTFYTAITFGGLIVDMTSSTGLVYLANFPLLIAGAFGLLAGAVTNYFIHLNVTFKNRNLSASWDSLFRYLKTCTIGMAIRLLVLTLLGWFSSFPSVVSLFLATGISFAVNYVLSRFYVFRHKNY